MSLVCSSHSKSPGRVRNGDAALGRAASAIGKPTTRLNSLCTLHNRLLESEVL
jgi:hypothetical protein